MAVAQLELGRFRLGRVSTVQRLADILRARITDGFFPPGTRLSEKSIGEALGVSRNTLRESFKLLTRERLLVHELNRGVFVRVLTADDVVDVYRLRRHIECAAVRGVTEPPGDRLRPVEAAVAAAAQAAERGAWHEVGTTDIRFHQAIVRLAGSARIDELMRRLLAELRLVFHTVADPGPLHEPYLARNAEILHALRAGDGARAERLLAAYLDDSERQLLQAYDSAPRNS